MAYQAAVITVSDACSSGTRVDTSGPAVCELLRAADFEVIYTATVPDEREIIARELRACTDSLRCDLVVTTGGTGLSPRDVTPEATRDILEREVPAIAQAMLIESLRHTSRAMLSRATVGTRGGSLIVNLPGSERAARENLTAVVDTLAHGIKMLHGGGHEK